MTYISTKNLMHNHIARFILVIVLGVSMTASLATYTYAATFAVTTDFPSAVGSVYSMLNGYIINNSGEEVVVWFEFGRDGVFSESTYRLTTSKNRNFSARINQLDRGVEYQYRAAARKISGGGTEYGETRVFTVPERNSGSSQTASGAGTTGGTNTSGSNSSTGVGPVVESDAGDVVATENTLTLKGTVVTGGVPTAAWFEWGTTPSLGNKTNPRTLPQTTAIVDFEETLTGLNPDTTYYYQLVSLNERGISRGNLTSVKTKGGGWFDGFGNSTGNNTDSGVSFGDTTGSGSTGSQNTAGASVPFGPSGSLTGSTKEKSAALSWGEILQSELFTIDEKGNVYTSQHSFSFGGEKNQPSVLASVFSSGAGILPHSFAGWALWIILTFVIIFQLRSAAAKRAKKKAEKELREQELSEIRRYQEVAGKAKKTA